MNDKEKEMRIVTTLPLIANWLQRDKKLTDAEIKTFSKLYPEQYEFLLNSTLEEIIEMFSRYRESKIYGKYIEILLSPQGIQWLRKNLSRIKELHKD